MKKNKIIQSSLSSLTHTHTRRNKSVDGDNELTERGVVYLGHIPYGFFEKEMNGFFSQFGNVTRLRLARNKKTGNSRHFAFIEFDNPQVAQIVAQP